MFWYSLPPVKIVEFTVIRVMNVLACDFIHSNNVPSVAMPSTSNAISELYPKKEKQNFPL